MSSVASQAVEVINEIGIFDVLVPFIVAMAAMFGMLEKTALFGKDRHDVNAIVSLAIGIVFALNATASQFLMNFVPLAIILALFLFIGLLVGQWVGLKPDFFIKMVQNPAVFIPVVIVLLILVMVGFSGGLDVIMGTANYTGSLGVPTENITAQDLANPAVVLTQPQVAGGILVLVVFAVVTFMITQK